VEVIVYERCLNEAERILASDRDVIVPVKKVWKEVEKQGREQGFEVPSLGDFSALLEADKRFEFVSTPTDDELDSEDRSLEDEQEEMELEQLGFYAGDRVKLRRIDLTPELIGSMIRRKVDLTMDALTKAWELRPEGDQEAEDQLLEILAKTQRLQREVKKTFSEERMKELTESIKKAPPAPKAKPISKKSPKRTSRTKKRPVAKSRTHRSTTSRRPQRGRRK
jgi:hypothetical protein